MRISPWWLLAAAIALGAALTGIVGTVGSESLSALDWLATTATVGALVVAVGIYRLQGRRAPKPTPS
jgi:Na+/H+-dicarboxylate symporter